MPSTAARHEVVFPAKTYTAAGSDLYVLDALNMAPPFVISVQTENGGGSAPVTPTIDASTEQSVDADGPWNAVADLTIVQIAAAGDQFAQSEETNQVARYLRVTVTYGAGTVNDGTKVSVSLVGNAS